MDNTTFISEDTCPVKELSTGIRVNYFQSRTGNKKFPLKNLPGKEVLNNVIESSTINTTLKSGDLVYIELCAPLFISAGIILLLITFSSPDFIR